MIRKSICLFLSLFPMFTYGVGLSGAEGNLPDDILQKLNHYNVVWNTPSTTGSMECMPLGNGDITVNAWIEQDGDLMLYIGKGDTWSEATRLLKVGRLRIKLSPNPFTEGGEFRQELNLYRGEMHVVAKHGVGDVGLTVWIDANRPVIHVEIDSKEPMTVKCIPELMRSAPFTLQTNDDPVAGSFRGVTDGPVRPTESADKRIRLSEAIGWYHRNESSFYPTIFERQNVSRLLSDYPDPYLNRTFGALVRSEQMKPENDSTLVSQDASRKHIINIYPYTAQTRTVAAWTSRLEEVVNAIEKDSLSQAYRKHLAWWDGFWNRSWIFLSGDADAETVTRAYLLQRYMMACQSRGVYPVKFNGGSLTFDYQGNDGDYRAWGPGYWNQNCRLYYWPLAASGDYDLKRPWFDMYMHMLPLQRDITRIYYGHDGAFFPETFNFFGMYIQDDWGWDNPGNASQTRWIRYHYAGALEVLADMLDCYNYTKDEAFARDYIVPFATQVIRFFHLHWPVVNHTLRFIPANALEQFWDCLNPIDYIAGLRYDITQLEETLPGELLDDDLLQEWNACMEALPPLPQNSDERYLLPAEEYGVGRNVENPECYAIFPFRLYGLGLPNMDVALNTFARRSFTDITCWSQDPIQASLLGLADLAKTYLLKHAASTDPAVRFPAFWKPSSDYVPDFDNGGALCMGLQYMLLQNVGRQILLLPALPQEWQVDFKLHAYDNTVIRAKGQGSKVERMDISPESRRVDVVMQGNGNN